MSFECFFETYIVPSIPIIAVYLVYRLGKKSYYQQKEYELVINRYLEQGIDSISKNVDSSLAVFRHNWWHSTAVLKNFRDLGEDMNKSLYQEGLIEPNTQQFELWRDHRLRDIVGDDIYNKAHQSLDAFVKTSYAFFKNDLCHGVRLSVEGGQNLEVTVSNEKLAEEFFKEAHKLHKESYRYYALIAELQKLSSLIQTERMSFDNLSNIQKRTSIKDSLAKLKELFPDKEEAENDT